MAMMSWLRSLDVALFRFINETLSNSLFDRIMPFFSGNSVFVPLLVALAAILVWKKGARGRVCLIMLALVICLGRAGRVWGIDAYFATRWPKSPLW